MPRADVIIAATILVAGVALGAVYRKAYDDAGGQQDLPTREFGAAVAMACGHGYSNPGYTLTPQLDEFLTNKRDAMSCSDLPPALPQMDLNATQRLYRYLMMSAGALWKFTGVSWKALRPLYAAMYGITLVVAYGIFRLGIGRVLSAAATLGLAVSPVHLQHLPFLRDYAKAPFILALILIMGRAAMGPWSARRILIYSGAFGLVLGLGFGFRNDLLIAIVPWLVVVFFALPGPLTGNLKIKAAGIAVSAAAFVVAAWPILSGYAAGSNTGHVAVLGLMTPFDAAMGLTRPVYDTGNLYNDQYGWTIVQSFAFREHGKSVLYMEKEYDRLAVLYVMTIARHWPADIIARAYASMRTILELPFAVGEHVKMIPVGAEGSSLILWFYSNTARVLHFFYGFGSVLAAAALGVISLRNLRAAIVLLFMVAYFAGYPALQFHVRHFFHLEFLGWFALAFLIDRVVVAVRERNGFETRAFGRAAARGAAFAAGAAVVLIAVLAVARVYQTAHGRMLLREQYLSADRETVATQETIPAAGRVLVDASGIWHAKPAGAPITTEYVVAEFSGGGCRGSHVPATLRYATTVPGYDFSHEFDVRLDAGGPSIVMAPVFDVPGASRFAGFELAAADAACLSRIARVKTERIPPVLLDINAPASWEHSKLYQTIAAWE